MRPNMIKCSALVLAAVTACGFKFQTSTSGGFRHGSAAAGGGISTSFPLKVDGPIQLVSEFGGAPGEKAVAVCEWQKAEGLRPHLGGGHYGNLSVTFDFKFPEDEKGPCDELAAKASPERELMQTALRAMKCTDCVRGAKWMFDTWSVQDSAEGNPIQMFRDARILVVIRKSGTTRAIPPLPESAMTSDKMKQQLTKVCTFPPGNASCGIKSAAIEHVVKFFDTADTKQPSYEVLANVTVDVGGTTGVCEMRVVIDDNDGVMKFGEGQCRHTKENDSMSTWDPRGMTADCIANTTASRQ